MFSHYCEMGVVPGKKICKLRKQNTFLFDSFRALVSPSLSPRPDYPAAFLRAVTP